MCKFTPVALDVNQKERKERLGTESGADVTSYLATSPFFVRYCVGAETVRETFLQSSLQQIRPTSAQIMMIIYVLYIPEMFF